MNGVFLMRVFGRARLWRGLFVLGGRVAGGEPRAGSLPPVLMAWRVMKSEGKIFVVAAGDLGGEPFFREMAAIQKPKAVICADGGARHLVPAGIMPEVVVGDMDSIDGETLRHYEENGCRIVKYPKKKDDTDTELALEEAFLYNPAEVWIWGAMGGRIDHALANVSLLWLGMKRGVRVKLVDSRCEVFMIDRKTVIEGERGQTVSLLPVTEKVAGITLEGFEYPLKNGAMELGRPLGISNRLLQDRGSVEVASGVLLAVRYLKPDVFV